MLEHAPRMKGGKGIPTSPGLQVVVRRRCEESGAIFAPPLVSPGENDGEARVLYEKDYLWRRACELSRSPTFSARLSLSLTSSLLRHFDPPLSFTFSHSPFSSIYVYILSRVRVIKYTGIESNRSRMTIGIYVTFGFADVCLADILAE